MSSHLTDGDREILLDLAFQSVKAAAHRSEIPEIDKSDLSTALREPTATFVTLSLEGALRGCLGTTSVQNPLAEDVVLRAYSAASRDPRFPAISPDELAHLEIEISLLTPPKALEFSDTEKLLEQLESQRGGVIVKQGTKRATFLPQVWERVPDAQTFLELLCQKASLHRDAWRTEQVTIEVYRVESFHRRPLSEQAQ